MRDVLVPSICKREISPESIHSFLALVEFVDNPDEVIFKKKMGRTSFKRTPKGLTGN